LCNTYLVWDCIVTKIPWESFYACEESRRLRSAAPAYSSPRLLLIQRVFLGSLLVWRGQCRVICNMLHFIHTLLRACASFSGISLWRSKASQRIPTPCLLASVFLSFARIFAHVRRSQPRSLIVWLRSHQARARAADHFVLSYFVRCVLCRQFFTSCRREGRGPSAMSRRLRGRTLRRSCRQPCGRGGGLVYVPWNFPGSGYLVSRDLLCPSLLTSRVVRPSGSTVTAYFSNMDALCRG
jgi:hypothetical protein